MDRRIISLWFPRLASERVLRAQPVDAPFALTHTQSNTQKIYCLNAQAEVHGLRRDMSFSDARVLCPDLQTRLANPVADARFLQTLARWSGRYCPWVGVDKDGLVLDVTGSTHLFGGDKAMLLDMQARLDRAGLSHKTGLADTRGAAWALARYGGGSLDVLPVAALRLPDDICNGLARLGVKTIADLRALPRITLARRFGAAVLLQLDRALGDQPEPVSPQSETPHFAVRMTLPEPIGLISDVTIGLERLLERLCETLAKQEMGARRMQFTARRVDMASSQIEVRFARPMRDPVRIAALFARGLEEIDSGYGIDQIRLEAIEVEKLPLRQITHHKARNDDHLADLITRLGNRVGLENILRHHPADSHIPEKSFIAMPAAYTEPATGGWFISAPRPLVIFPAEPIRATGPQPPKYFNWRRMPFRIAHATGPERIAPEWWLDNPDWRSGLRDYWRISTCEGRRLWLFFTQQDPCWFVQGEFA